MDSKNSLPLTKLKSITSSTDYLLESPNTPSPAIVEGPHLGFRRRVGDFGLFLLVPGSIVALGALSFISFLWKANDDSEVWRRVMLTGWGPRAVTIASLIIRTVITAQAAFCTSILASLALRRFDVLLPKLAAVSILRFENSGPQSLLFELKGSLKLGRALVVGSLTILLVISNIGLQFTSTILLNDLGLIAVTDLPKHLTVNYGYNTSIFNGTGVLNDAFWDTKPDPYPTFAEYHEDRVEGDDFYDTGLLMRAFFPVNLGEEMDHLLSYSGMATVVDSRVACARPLLKDFEVSILQTSEISAPSVSGLIGTDASIPRFKSTPLSQTLDFFNCSTAVGPTSTHEWPLTACRLNMTSGIVSIMDDEVDGMPWYMSNGPGAAYLVSNITGSYEKWEEYTMSPSDDSSHDVSRRETSLRFAGPEKYTGDGEWLTIPSNDPTISISLSICYSAFHAEDLDIKATALATRIPPSIGWDHTTHSFSTSTVRTQLGATLDRPSLSSRGLFSLARLPTWMSPLTSTRPTLCEAIIRSANINWADHPFYTALLCQHCTPNANGSTYEWVHQTLTAVVTDTVAATSHPALGLQAHFTTLFGLAYFRRSIPFDVPAPATLLREMHTLAPAAWMGFYIVAALLGLHFALVSGVVAWFVGVRRAGPDAAAVGNAWAAVDQVRGAAIERWMDGAGGMSDGAVEEGMRRSGVAGQWVGLWRTLDGREVLGRRRRDVIL